MRPTIDRTASHMDHPFHLAQANIARMRGPLESPVMERFRTQIDRVNTLAERSAGFVWRLQSDEADARARRVFDDDLILFNLSIWESVEALRRFTYDGAHADLFRDRQEWFQALDKAHLVLWWVAPGYRPTVEDAKVRLDMLEQVGPTEQAFTFRKVFPPGRDLVA